MLGPNRARKLQYIDALEHQLDQGFEHWRPGNDAVRIFSYPLDDTLAAFQREEYLEEPVFVPELWATHRWLERLCTEHLATDDPTTADAFYLPLFLPVFETAEFDLRPVVESLQFITTGKPHIVGSFWDGYPRPPGARANPFCLQSLGRLQSPDTFDTHWSWLDEQFSVITLCSSIDVHPNDHNTLPLLNVDCVQTHERSLLYSFCGEARYTSVPDAHIRSVHRAAEWKQLADIAPADSFIGTLSEAQDRFGPDTTYRSMPYDSYFTLCPAGISRWSFRTIEAIAGGSIPVLLSDYSVRPYSDLLDWDSFSISLPENALLDVDRILRALHPDRVRALRHNVEAAQRHISAAGLASLLTQSLKTRLHGAT